MEDKTGTMKKYQIIYADPPWQFDYYSRDWRELPTTLKGRGFQESVHQTQL